MNSNSFLNYLLAEARKLKIREMLSNCIEERNSLRKKRNQYEKTARKIKDSMSGNIEYATLIDDKEQDDV